MTISGLGHHGERAAPPERVSLLPDDRKAARNAAWHVAVGLHTLESDWAKRQLAGMVGIFGDCGAAVIDAVDCASLPERQVAELDRLIAQRPDAILSLPVANDQAAAAHARVSAAAQTAILSLLSHPVPAWIALPGRKVTRDNVVKSFQTVWRQPAPKEVIRVLGLVGQDQPRFSEWGEGQ
jgi:ABC-type sugar transport system substrate-binding protein